MVKPVQTAKHPLPQPHSSFLDDAACRRIRIERLHTRAGEHPYDQIEWQTRTACIADADGNVVFEQPNLEFPATWSQTAVNIVASKYFRGRLGTPQRETSLRQLIDRVVNQITAWGTADGYFADTEAASAFSDELTYLLLHQMASFNSPVWFNLGVDEKPQCSACFINSVEDSMASILELAKTEGMLFKGGSGSGTNLSRLRSSVEPLASGGTASGPVSFMRGYDAFAAVIKSGGKTRRAAKMVCLDASHPDIEAFITCKADEEQKAHRLIEAGYDGSLDGAAYASVSFQNANHSVRVTDEFMQAVQDDGEWQTRLVTTGEVHKTYRARDLMRQMAEAAHACGDPGLQFDNTINAWHTCANTDRIHASNPCSEFMFLDDTACNLASINLMAFRGDEDEPFRVAAFRHAVHILIIAQDILVDRASYPTPTIAQRSHDFRPLGLGYTNLGALLMSWGEPYYGAGGWREAAAIAAIMTGQAYLTSAQIAAVKGPFAGYEHNREPMQAVIRRHREVVEETWNRETETAPAYEIWDEARAAGRRHGFRNSQVTVLAPTGTISFMMDCDTTGIEPDLALVKYKSLVGGGLVKTQSRALPLGLQTLGYSEAQTLDIVEYVTQHEGLDGAPHLQADHLPVFDCAFPAPGSERCISVDAHLLMMAEVQPFLSGAISKTVNLPATATVEDVEHTYMKAWEFGLKAVAIYRDGSKRTQPLNQGTPSVHSGKRIRLPDERPAVTHKFQINGHEGYITVGLFDNGQPGEIFLRMSKQGSTISGLMDAFATAISLALQYGVPLDSLASKFSHMRFEPSGPTTNRDIPVAQSVADYIFRWLTARFAATSGDSAAVHLPPPNPQPSSATALEMPPCPECGAWMQRSGTCYTCPGCGLAAGCG